MEERMSWREAFGTAWGNLTGVNNESGSVRGIRILFFLIFIGGIAWAGFNYHKAQQLLEEKDYQPSTPPAQVDADSKRLSDMVAQVKVTSEMRANSSIIARTMQEDLAKYPFGDPVSVVEGKPGDLRPVTVVEVPEVAIEMPPDITLRAIMIMGRQQVAIMDIAGVGTGMVVRAGDTFMQKKGRVVRIAADKVVMRWGGRNFDIRPNF